MKPPIRPSYEQRTDSELAEMVKSGDHYAFQELDKRYRGQLLRLLSRMRGDTAAPDLVQEVLLKAYDRIKQFEDSGTGFKPWIMRIAKNQAIDHLRSADTRQNEVTSSLDETAHNPHLPDPSPEENAFRKEAITLTKAVWQSFCRKIQLWIAENWPTDREAGIRGLLETRLLRGSVCDWGKVAEKHGYKTAESARVATSRALKNLWGNKAALSGLSKLVLRTVEEDEKTLLQPRDLYDAIGLEEIQKDIEHDSDFDDTSDDSPAEGEKDETDEEDEND